MLHPCTNDIQRPLCAAEEPHEASVPDDEMNNCSGKVQGLPGTSRSRSTALILSSDEHSTTLKVCNAPDTTLKVRNAMLKGHLRHMAT